MELQNSSKNNLEIVRYHDGLKNEWDEFVKNSRNGVFLFFRDYIEYHKERFEDFSLVVVDKGKIVSLFPASFKSGKVQSHGGLTYGGLICSISQKAASTFQAIDAIKIYYASAGASAIIYKTVPSIFHKYPSEDDVYHLWRTGADLYRRDLSCAIKFSNAIKFSKGKLEGVKKAVRANLTFSRSADYKSFFELANKVLLTRHGVVPVHNFQEMKYLKEKFPENIKLYVAKSQEDLIAGCIIYDFGDVVHTQYMFNSDYGCQVGALDFVIYNLIEEYKQMRTYLSFGISTEDDGIALNDGLMSQKEMLGGRSVVHDFYRVSLET